VDSCLLLFAVGSSDSHIGDGHCMCTTIVANSQNVRFSFRAGSSMCAGDATKNNEKERV